MAKSSLISIPQFAKVMGVSAEVVRRAVKAGKITAKKEGSFFKINPIRGKKEWAANNQKSRNPSGLEKPKTKVVVQKQKVEVPMFEGMTTADADRKKKVFEARLAELKFSEQAGQLLKVDDVKDEAYSIARATRDAILSLPARIAHEIAAETDPRQAELLLLKELTKALQNLIKERGRGKK